MIRLIMLGVTTAPQLPYGRHVRVV